MLLTAKVLLRTDEIFNLPELEVAEEHVCSRWKTLQQQWEQRHSITLRAPFASARGKVPLLAHSSSEHTSRSKAEERKRGGGPKATTEAIK